MSTRLSRVFSTVVGLILGAGVLMGAAPSLPSPGGGVRVLPSQARGADPRIGPHARDEAKHRDQQVALTPAQSAIVPRKSATVPGTLAARTVGLRPAQASAINGRPAQREVMGFAPYWSLPAEASWNYNLLSTIAYFGVDVNADGSFATSTRGWTGFNSQEFVDAINRAHQAGDRAVVVIKAFDEATINSIVTTSAGQVAITNTINAIAQKNLDGVNIDFEGYANSAFPNLPSGLVNFAGQMTAQVHQRFPWSTVTIDTYSGSASWDSGFFNIGQLAPVVDGMFVMAYDMSFGNLPGHAGPNAPLYGWTYNDTTAVAQYLTKAPASKVILGVPYYAYKWSTSTNLPYGVATDGATAETYASIADDFSCAQRLTLAWDTTAQSPWASWWSPAVNDPCGANHNSWRELYYDNADSLGLKYDLVNAQGLAGVGMWALGYDGNAPELWNVIERKLVNPFKAMYALDGFGGLHPVGSSLPATWTGYWPGWKIARAGALLPDASGGYVLEGFGGVHPFRVGSNSMPASVADYAYWNGWDIARDIVLLPTSTAARPQGYTLDGFGGIHQFGGAPVVRGAQYWNGWDIARRLVLLPDGTGGYVLDGYGGLHGFAVGTNSMPPAITNFAYWSGWNIARDLALVPGSTAATVGGVTLEGFGGPHPFGNAGGTGGFAYWSGWDIARSVRLSPVSTAAQPQGWVLDGFGGVHQFGGAPPLSMSAYWNWDIAVQLLIA